MHNCAKKLDMEKNVITYVSDFTNFKILDENRGIEWSDAGSKDSTFIEIFKTIIESYNDLEE